MGPGTENLFFLAASLKAKVDNVPASKPQPLARMTGGVDAANKGFLLQRWQLEGEGVQQVG